MSHDFDFFTGTWNVHNRRLRSPLVGSEEWYEFPGTSQARSILAGAGNMDEIDFPDQGWSGLTLRLYDPVDETWSLHWVSSTRTTIDPPVIGKFENGRGEFFADDTYEGRPIRVRYLWSGISATTAHWEQAFSADDGHSWETNWTMDFTRDDL